MALGRGGILNKIDILIYYSFVCIVLTVGSASVHAKGLGVDIDPDYQKRTLICTANVYVHTGENDEISVSKDQVKDSVQGFVKRKTDEYLKKRLTKGSVYRILPQNGTNFQIMIDSTVDASELGENLQGTRFGGVLEYEIDGIVGDRFLSVAVDSDKSTYQEGDALLFLVAGNKDFYMRLFEDSPDQKIFQIVPNHYRPQDFYPSGQYIFPDKVAGDQFTFTVEKPLGVASLHLLGSEHRLIEIPVNEFDPIEEIRGKYIKSILDEMVMADPSNTFQCVQFVESMKTLTFIK